MFEQNEIYVCKTVLLETERVLRFSYELEGATVLRALKGVVGLPQVTVKDGLAVAQALDLLEAGMDLAGALHLASSPEGAQFATFDRRLRMGADPAAPSRRVVEL